MTRHRRRKPRDRFTVIERRDDDLDPALGTHKPGRPRVRSFTSYPAYQRAVRDWISHPTPRASYLEVRRNGAFLRSYLP